jgi:hypothetical protein
MLQMIPENLMEMPIPKKSKLQRKMDEVKKLRISRDHKPKVNANMVLNSQKQLINTEAPKFSMETNPLNEVFNK